MWMRICSRRKLIWCCRCLSCMRASWSALARVSSWAICPSMTSNWRCAFTAGSNDGSWLIYDLNRVTPAQFFHARNKTTVRTDIISICFQQNHEVAGTLHGKHHFGLAFAFMADGVQRVHGGLSRGIQGHADADGARQFGLRFLKRRQLVDDDLGI